MAEEISKELQAQLDGIKKTQEDQAKTIGDLQTQNEDLKKENEGLKKQLTGLAASGPEEKKDDEPKIPTETFSVGKAKYKFAAAKMIVPGIGAVTAQEALVDDEKHDKLGKKTIKEWLVANESELVKSAE
ncbi:hypothetical protein QEG73_21930 [Chitinophagaceae bacterium 26-R-25]|nr:hypothetical protein [Chitinophagaceae bacterium 26-R-25]